MPTLTTLAAAGFLLLGASSLVAATPAPDRVRVRQDGVANFPVAATLAAQMLPDVDPVFKADLEANVVINLDQPLVKSRRGRRDWYGPDNPHGSKREPQEGGGANPEIPPVGEPVGRRAPQSSGAKPDPEEGGGDDPRTHKGRQTSTCTIEGYVLVFPSSFVLRPPPPSPPIFPFRLPLLSSFVQKKGEEKKEKKRRERRKLTNIRAQQICHREPTTDALPRDRREPGGKPRAPHLRSERDSGLRHGRRAPGRLQAVGRHGIGWLWHC